MGSWAWRLFIGEFGLDEIGRFGSSCEAIVPMFFLVVLILNKQLITAPGPGIFCI